MEITRHEKLFVITGLDALTPRECADRMAHAEAGGFEEEAPITTFQGFVHRPDLRNNARHMEDDPDTAAWLWPRVRALVPETVMGWRAVGLNERLRTYRYGPGQKFGWHGDGAFIRSETERSFFTLMVYLNDDFSGGCTEFEDGATQVTIRPRAGMALAFWHPLLHQGAPVERGVKYVLRSDVMYRRLDDG